jgi:hypothetical protein
VTLRLAPEDISGATLRSTLLGAQRTGRYGSREILLVRLRHGITPPFPAFGGWLPLYWVRGLTSQLPAGLLAVFATFAGPHLDPRLRRTTLKRHAAANRLLASKS